MIVSLDHVKCLRLVEDAKQEEQDCLVLVLFPPDSINEASSVLRKQKKATSKVVKKMATAPKIGTGKKTFDYPEANKKKKITKRKPNAVRTKAKDGGSPKPAKKDADITPDAMNIFGEPTTQPKYAKDKETWPANWKTTSKGKPIKIPDEVKKRKRAGSAVSQSDFYKHVVRAVYNSGTQRGYPFRGTPEKSSQAIARAQLIKWGYAGRAKKAGGVPDKFAISLTGKGKARARKHASEPKAVRVAKDQDYQAIAGTDPL